MDTLTALEQSIKALPHDCEVTIHIRDESEIPAGYEQQVVDLELGWDKYRKVLDAHDGIVNKEVTLYIKID